MSSRPIDRSKDLKALRHDGYDLEIRAGFLLVRDVPYVGAGPQVKRGTMVMKLVLADDVTGPPDDHVAYFIGDYPCHADGREIDRIRNSGGRRELAKDVIIDHAFSAKPAGRNYPDYHAKVTTYVSILAGPAKVIDPAVTARTYPVISADAEGPASVFAYIDTASSRAEIDLVSAKLEMDRIAIVGLGGTGSYVLDLVAKTPVKQIHLYDGDTFWQHNAFRAPGAPSTAVLGDAPKKVAYFKGVYSNMHLGIIEHPEFVHEGNVAELQGMKFVFLTMEGGADKKMIVEHLESFAVPFVDVGMGIDETDGSLGGILRVTTSTPEQRTHFRSRVSFGDGEADEYARNIQVADLNALNAALAVIKWKKLAGFYRDLDREHHCCYTIDGNMLTNGDRP